MGKKRISVEKKFALVMMTLKGVKNVEEVARRAEFRPRVYTVGSINFLKLGREVYLGTVRIPGRMNLRRN